MESSSGNDRSNTNIGRLLNEAQEGCNDSMTHLLEPCREYLMAVAKSELDSWLRVKIGASDLVQETFVAAYKKIKDFRGTSEPEFLGWLRTILLNNLATNVRSYRFTEKRRVDREIPLTQAVTRASPTTKNPLSELLHAEKAERVHLAIKKLNDDYRQVVELRILKQLSFDEIGRRIGRSEEAARKLWVRALVVLSELLEDPHDPV